MAKNRRQNHDFQIAYFLAGKCHTPDGAYALLCDLKDDRELAIRNYHVSEKRQRAVELRARAKAQSGDEADRLEAEAELEEIENGRSFGRALFETAEQELAFINGCMEKLQPLRRYAHLPDPEAHEAAQREEWRLELIARAENFMLTAGVIPADEFATMRAHPDFAASILPAIEQIAGKKIAADIPDRRRLGAVLGEEPALPNLGAPASHAAVLEVGKRAVSVGRLMLPSDAQASGRGSCG